MCCSNEERAKMEPEKLLASDLSVIKGMHFFDPHIHMVSRTTDDYQAMADSESWRLLSPHSGSASHEQVLLLSVIIIVALSDGKGFAPRSLASNIIARLG